MLRLSIVVPVYNVEKYLAKCLDSLLQQDIASTQYEIVLVNDGSSDHSLPIAEDFQKEYSNIRIISQPNQGLGAARNTGIRAAEGKYIMFVDSDDYLQQNVLAELLDLMENKQLDALRFNYQAVTETGEILPKKLNSLKTIVYSAEIVDGSYFLSRQLGWACYVCMYLFETTFIKKNGFYFKEDLLYEDMEWLPRVLLKIKKIRSYNKHVYNYLQRSGSITKNIEFNKRTKIFEDKIYVISFLQKKSQEQNNNDLKMWFLAQIALTVKSVFDFVNGDKDKEREFIQFLRKNKLLPLVCWRFTLKQRLYIALINVLSPKFYFYFLKIKYFQ